MGFSRSDKISHVTPFVSHIYLSSFISLHLLVLMSTVISPWVRVLPVTVTRWTNRKKTQSNKITGMNSNDSFIPYLIKNKFILYFNTIKKWYKIRWKNIPCEWWLFRNIREFLDIYSYPMYCIDSLFTRVK